MNITILDDYQDTIRTLPCFSKVAEHHEDEPVLGARHPLLAMDNVVCTPHLGYVERNGLQEMFSTIFDQVLAYAGGKPINVVNPEALEGMRRA